MRNTRPWNERMKTTSKTTDRITTLLSICVYIELASIMKEKDNQQRKRISNKKIGSTQKNTTEITLWNWKRKRKHIENECWNYVYNSECGHATQTPTFIFWVSSNVRCCGIYWRFAWIFFFRRRILWNGNSCWALFVCSWFTFSCNLSFALRLFTCVSPTFPAESHFFVRSAIVSYHFAPLIRWKAWIVSRSE